jgi:FkbM family methyltransferase
VSEQTRPGIGARLGAISGKVASNIGRVGHGPVGIEATVPAPLLDGAYELVEVDAGSIWISRDDEVMRPFMQRAGTWEAEEGRLLLSFVRPGTRFLDVGANVGYFSVLVGKAAPGVTVDSVEPDPDNVRALRFNLWSNRVKATVWPLALDNRDRYLALSGNAHNLGDLRSGRIDPAEHREPTEEAPVARHRVPDADDDTPRAWIVPAASGDELFVGRGFDLVKVDVQGWEFEVLLGLDAVLARSPGVRVVTEFWPAPLRATDRHPTDVLARYRQLGYRIRVALGDDVVQMADAEIVAVCDSGGRDGQVNLLLER